MVQPLEKEMWKPLELVIRNMVRALLEIRDGREDKGVLGAGFIYVSNFV